MKMTYVWDPLVRLGHWLMVAGFTLAWLTADEWQSVHELAGYGVMGLLAWRITWGFFGSRYARFRQFVRSPSESLSYINDVRQGRERRYLGHNPAGALMVLALLGGLAMLTLSGWLYTRDTALSGDMLEEVHEFIGNGVLVFIGLHIAGVLLASYRHRENLVKAMLTGKKRQTENDDIG